MSVSKTCRCAAFLDFIFPKIDYILTVNQTQQTTWGFSGLSEMFSTLFLTKTITFEKIISWLIDKENTEYAHQDVPLWSAITLRRLGVDCYMADTNWKSNRNSNPWIGCFVPLQYNTFQAATHKKRNLKGKKKKTRVEMWHSLGLCCYTTLERVPVYNVALPKRGDSMLDNTFSV